MEWNNSKIPCWDFTEFERETIPNTDSNNGSSSFSVDLKLGDSRNAKMVLSSSKRSRPVNHGAICLVDGCKADLSKCKEYHRRHKVCEIHSKTPEVLINGQKQRFCQQCSRFHSLEEFDEGKRSCRKRLDGHNRRRRKPQPDTSRAAASLFSTHQGTTMLQFGSPHMYQTTALTNPVWMSMVKRDEEPTYPPQTHKQNPYPELSSGSKKLPGKPQFSLFNSGSHLKLNHQTSPPKVCHQQLLSFENGYPPPARVVQPVVQTDCALSLLSSSPSQTSCTTLSHVMQPPVNSFSATANALDTGAGYGGLESIMDHHGSCNDEVPQTLPFYWE